MSNEIKFDSYGNITPYTILSITIDDFEKIFIKSITPSSSRPNIYNGYKRYVAEFYKSSKTYWFQWCNGSYTTNKLEPNDVDLVNFVNANVLNDKFKTFMTKHGSKDKYNVDGYIVPVYEKNDERYAFTIVNLNYWKKWFGYDRNKRQKGIVELNINNHFLNYLGINHD